MRLNLLLLFILTTSCKVFYPNGIKFNIPNYAYEYRTFSKKINYKQGKYLLAPTSFSGHNLGTNLDYVYNFFKPKLNNNIVLTKDLKDINGKRKIPFIISYDISDENINFIANTGFDFLILTKIIYLKHSKNIIANSKNPLGNDGKAGAMSLIKVIDLKNNLVFLEMVCSGNVSIPNEEDIDTGNIYADSYSLGNKTMKKLLKKLK